MCITHLPLHLPFNNFPHVETASIKLCKSFVYSLCSGKVFLTLRATLLESLYTEFSSNLCVLCIITKYQLIFNFEISLSKHLPLHMICWHPELPFLCQILAFAHIDWRFIFSHISISYPHSYQPCACLHNYLSIDRICLISKNSDDRKKHL